MWSHGPPRSVYIYFPTPQYLQTIADMFVLVCCTGPLFWWRDEHDPTNVEAMVKLDGVAPLMTDLPQTSSTTLSGIKSKKNYM